jgi:hypothetical protein
VPLCRDFFCVSLGKDTRVATRLLNLQETRRPRSLERGSERNTGGAKQAPLGASTGGGLRARRRCRGRVGVVAATQDGSPEGAERAERGGCRVNNEHWL